MAWAVPESDLGESEAGATLPHFAAPKLVGCQGLFDMP